MADEGALRERSGPSPPRERQEKPGRGTGATQKEQDWASLGQRDNTVPNWREVERLSPGMCRRILKLQMATRIPESVRAYSEKRRLDKLVG